MTRYHLISTVLLILFVNKNYAAPTDTTPSLIVISTTETTENNAKTQKEETSTEIPLKVPKIYQMHVNSKISNRYANTTITSKVKNIADKPQEATFSVVLPETAFISGFIMEVDGKNYTAYVKEKEEAKKTYDEAVASGLGAAHVAVNARDSNRFTVSVNVEPETKAAFYLIYEELLKRKDGHYELVLNLHPGQPVKDLSVEVIINESRKVTQLKAPPLRSGNEIGNENEALDPRADLVVVNDTSAIVRFTPNLERQKQLTNLLGNAEIDGLAGQFVVQYDVERDPKGGEVLVEDGYFVHFFAPSEIKPLPKHVVFVLDTSYSMVGIRISQLREAMDKILGELKENDLFNIVEFSTNIKVWNLDDHNASVWYPTDNEDAWRNEDSDEDITKYEFPDAYQANVDNIKKAKATVAKLEPNGGTDIHNGLTVGLYLVELARRKSSDKNSPQPMIVFLTDGEPTIGLTDTEEIMTKISEYNSGSRKSPIFTLSFGDDADKDFLQKISLRNSGFSRHIYEAADASLQLQEFYQQISSPLLSNVAFKYEPSVTSLTRTDFPIHFGGSELVVAGWCGTVALNAKVEGWAVEGPINFEPAYERPVSNIERLWAYLTVKQLLEKKEASDKDQDESKKKALNLALKYSFVTPVSSLVVVKPNKTDAVDTETASKEQRFLPSPLGYSGAAPGGAVPLNGFIATKYADNAVDFRFEFAAEEYPEAIAVEEIEELISEAITTELSLGETTILDTSPTELGLNETTILDTSPTEPTINETSTSNTDTFIIFPWLKGILRENGTVMLPSGEYHLGLNVALADTVECPKTPLNETGKCTLLNACDQNGTLFTTVDLFIDHVCILENKYAGVCCSVKVLKPEEEN